MARTTIEIQKMADHDREKLRSDIAAIEGVRSVRATDDASALEIEYDETNVNANRFREALRERDLEPRAGIASPSYHGVRTDRRGIKPGSTR